MARGGRQCHLFVDGTKSEMDSGRKSESVKSYGAYQLSGVRSVRSVALSSAG